VNRRDQEGEISDFKKRRRFVVEFTQVVFELALEYPQANTIHLVMDSLNIHRRKSLTDLFSP
jgi:hypothetical protein